MPLQTQINAFDCLFKLRRAKKQKQNTIHRSFKPGTVNTSTKVTLQDRRQMFSKGHMKIWILQMNKWLWETPEPEVHLLTATHHKHRPGMDGATWQNAQGNFPNPVPTGHSWYATQAWPLPNPTGPERTTARVPVPDITGPLQRCPPRGLLHLS